MATIFAPPRNKPKISLSRPTLAVGQPYIPPQVINRPVNLVDDEGNIHGRLGENGQERVTVQSSGRPTTDPAGGPDYASGGTLLIGGDGQQAPGSTGNPFTDTIGTGIFGTQQQIKPPGNGGVGSTQGQPSWGSPPIIPPTGNGTYDPSLNTNPNNPNAQLLALQNQKLAANQNVLDTGKQVLDARGNLIPIQSSIRGMNSGITTMQENANSATRGVQQQEGNNIATRIGELGGIYTASQNAPDLINVADATNQYRAEDRRASKMGVAPAAEVNLPPGYNGPRLPGVRPKILSQEDRLKEKAGYEDPLRAENLALAKNAVSLMQTDINAATLAAKQAGYTLDEAQDVVKRAQLNEDYAKLNASQIDQQEQQNKIEPFPGAERYTNPQTGEGQWVTPWKAALLKREDQQALDQTKVANKYSNSTYYGAFAEPQLESFLRNGTMSPQQFIQELVVRGLTDVQADQLATDSLQQGKSGTLSLPVGANPSVAVKPAQAPASAPTQTNSAAVPNHYSGYTVP